MSAEKACTKCGDVKALEDFHRRKASKDGRRSACKVCDAERNRRYREANRAAELERKRLYREQNREALSERNRRYNEANREAVRERSRRYDHEVRGRIPGRNGSYAPRAVARRDDAHAPITFYLLAVEHEGQTFYVYGLSVTFVRRLADYRRQLDTVDIIATAEVDILTGARAEWNLSTITADVRQDFSALEVSGVATENLPDSAASVAAWREALHWAKRAAATADTAEAWLDARADLLS